MILASKYFLISEKKLYNESNELEIGDEFKPPLNVNQQTLYQDLDQLGKYLSKNFISSVEEFKILNTKSKNLESNFGYRYKSANTIFN